MRTGGGWQKKKSLELLRNSAIQLCIRTANGATYRWSNSEPSHGSNREQYSDPPEIHAQKMQIPRKQIDILCSKMEILHSKMEILHSKMEILRSEERKFPLCHGKLAFPQFSVPDWPIPHCQAQVEIPHKIR